MKKVHIRLHLWLWNDVYYQSVQFTDITRFLVHDNERQGTNPLCLIVFNTAKVADRHVKPRSSTISPGKIANISLLAFIPNPGFSGITAAALDPDNDTCRRTESSSHIDEAFDELSHLLESDLNAWNFCTHSASTLPHNCSTTSAADLLSQDWNGLRANGLVALCRIARLAHTNPGWLP